MNIALLNNRITFQEAVCSVDEIGNHTITWKDYFSCACTLAGEGGNETFDAGTKTATIDCTFTARFSSEVARVKADTHRIIFEGDVYNIVSVDHMSNTRKCVKFKCQKQRTENDKN